MVGTQSVCAQGARILPAPYEQEHGNAVVVVMGVARDPVDTEAVERHFPQRRGYLAIDPGCMCCSGQGCGLKRLLGTPHRRTGGTSVTSVDLDIQGRGAGVSWHFNFAWEISRFKLTAKFPTRNSGVLRDTSSAHCGLWRGGTTQNPGGSAQFPTAKFTTANLTWREIPPPPPVRSLCGRCTTGHLRVEIKETQPRRLQGVSALVP